MADPRHFAKLDLGYFDNPKVADLVDDNPRAVFLHLRAICYARQHLTDGVFPTGRIARSVGASWCRSDCDPHSDSQCDVCAARFAGLIERIDDRTSTVHDYHKHQQTVEDVQRLKDAGRKGARTRWERERAAAGNADRTTDGNADRNAEKRREEKRREDNPPTPRDGGGDAADGDAEIIEGELIDEGPDPIAEAFALFWQAYPRKVGKPKAEAAFTKAARSVGPDPILEGLSRHAPAWVAMAQNGRTKFIPHPTTWLNRQGWDDEPEAPPATPATRRQQERDARWAAFDRIAEGKQ